MFPNMEYIKTLVNGLKTAANSRFLNLEKWVAEAKTMLSALWSNRPNWLQDDPAALDYVEGRTHYTCYEEELRLNGAHAFPLRIAQRGSEDWPLIADGDTVRVEFDGVSYACKAVYNPEDNMCYFGSGALLEEVLGKTLAIEVGSDEPFFGCCMINNGGKSEYVKESGDLVSVLFGINPDGNSHAYAVYHVVEKVKQLDQKYLPDALHFGEETVNAPLEITWDGDTEGRASVAIPNGLSLVKVSDKVPLPNELASGTIISEGATFTIGVEVVLMDATTQGSPLVGLFVDAIGTQIPYVVVAYEPTSFSGMTFPEAGLYFLYNPSTGDGVDKLSLDSVTQTIIRTIDQKYLPNADWNAAEGEPGHVLNRTHWEDADGTIHTLDQKYLPLADNSGNAGALKFKRTGVAWKDNCTGVWADDNGYAMVDKTLFIGAMDDCIFNFSVLGVFLATTAGASGVDIAYPAIAIPYGTINRGFRNAMVYAADGQIYNGLASLGTKTMSFTRKPFVITSPNGTKYQITVGDDGTLSTTEVTA